MSQKTSLLTEKQRTFLRDEEARESLTRQGANQTRKRIRQRWRNALLDCQILLENIDEVGREKMLDPIGEDMSETDESDVRSGVASAIGLCYLMYERPERHGTFDMVVENAIQRAMQVNGYEATVFVDSEITDVKPVGDVVARGLAKNPLENPMDLSVRELNALWRNDELTVSEYQRINEARTDAIHGEGGDSE